MKSKWILSIFILVLLATAAGEAQDCSAKSGEVLSRFLNSVQRQKSVLLGYDAQVEAAITRLKGGNTTAGRLSVLRRLSPISGVIYPADWKQNFQFLIRPNDFTPAKYWTDLDIESLKKIGGNQMNVAEALSKARDTFLRDTAIFRVIERDINLNAPDNQADRSKVEFNTTNYSFQYQSCSQENGSNLLVYSILPQNKNEGLIAGHIQIEEGSGLPVYVEGELQRGGLSGVFLNRIYIRSKVSHHCGFSMPDYSETEIKGRRLTGVGDLKLSLRYTPLRGTFKFPQGFSNPCAQNEQAPGDEAPTYVPYQFER